MNTPPLPSRVDTQPPVLNAPPQNIRVAEGFAVYKQRVNSQKSNISAEYAKHKETDSPLSDFEEGSNDEIVEDARG